MPGHGERFIETYDDWFVRINKRVQRLERRLARIGADPTPTPEIPTFAVGTVLISGITNGNAVSVGVTFPSGRFSSTPYVALGNYTTIPGLRYSSHQNKSATGFTMYGGYQGASSSINLNVSWIAMQQYTGTSTLAAAARTMSTMEDSMQDAMGPMTAAGSEPDSICTCHTPGCANEGIGIPMALTWWDEETGEGGTVDSVACGVCGKPITDIVPIDPDPDPPEAGPVEGETS